MGRDRYDRRPLAGYEPAHDCGCSAGHERGHGDRDGRDHGCNRDRARELPDSSVSLLRDKVAGDYLAIIGDVHASTEHQPRFEFAIEAIGDGAIRLFQKPHDVLHVLPEIRVNRDFVIFEAIARHGRPAAGLSAGQLDVVQVNSIYESPHRQAPLVWIVDAKPQHELLLEKSGLDDFDVFELNLRILKIAAEPGRTTRHGA